MLKIKNCCPPPTVSFNLSRVLPGNRISGPDFSFATNPLEIIPLKTMNKCARARELIQTLNQYFIKVSSCIMNVLFYPYDEDAIYHRGWNDLICKFHLKYAGALRVVVWRTVIAAEIDISMARWAFCFFPQLHKIALHVSNKTYCESEMADTCGERKIVLNNSAAKKLSDGERSF